MGVLPHQRRCIQGGRGIGLIIYQSIFTSDFPVTQAAILIVAAIFVSINLLIDLLRIVADPRLRK